MRPLALAAAFSQAGQRVLILGAKEDKLDSCDRRVGEGGYHKTGDTGD